ncbi:MAG TPA: deoxyhypusine synthase [candidate division Zixibacteria bacterium]
MKKYLHSPTRPFEVRSDSKADDILERMGRISFQGRNLSIALSIWKEMLKGNNVIFLGLAGAMVPAGMRKIISFLIKQRYIDCLVSTGANLYHDLHESLGKYHWIGSCMVDDCDLQKKKIDRIYDTFASDREFRQDDNFIIDFVKTLDLKRTYTTREFLYLLGRKLSVAGETEGILSSAYKARVPIFCPALGDSSIGIAMVWYLVQSGISPTFDIVRDAAEISHITQKAKSTAVIYVGGGTPKNYIQQSEVIAAELRKGREIGHSYAIQITTDSPQWGGLSGCTFAEAQSWGKIGLRAKKVDLHADATIVLPILVTALHQSLGKSFKRKHTPSFDFKGKFDFG